MSRRLLVVLTLVCSLLVRGSPPPSAADDAAAAHRRLGTTSSCHPMKPSSFRVKSPAPTRCCCAGISRPAITSTKPRSRWRATATSCSSAPPPAEGRAEDRRVLRHAGGLSPPPRRRCAVFAREPRGGHLSDASDVPGLCGSGPVLSADHEDAAALAAAARRRRAGSKATARSGRPAAEQDRLADVVQDGSIFAVLGIFFSPWARADLHALRVADGADSLRHHRRPGQ